MLSWLCIFYFEKCVTQSIKVPFENKAADPTSPELWSPFFLSLSLSLSFSLFSGWIPGAQRPSEFTFLPGLLRPNQEGALRLYQGGGVLRPQPHREGACGLREQSKSRARGFIGFLCKPRNISLLFSLYSFSFILLSFQPWTIRFQSSIRPMSSLSLMLFILRVPLDPAGAGPQQWRR